MITEARSFSDQSPRTALIYGHKYNCQEGNLMDVLCPCEQNNSNAFPTKDVTTPAMDFDEVL